MLYVFCDLGFSDMESRETPDGLDIGGGVRIPADELSYRTSRSSGPGGQHVNKVETRVTVLFDLDGSPSLSEAQKERVRERLPTRITKAGVLWVVSQKHRSQKANRDAARERLALLLGEALRPRRPRKRTRPSGRAKRRRREGPNHPFLPDCSAAVPRRRIFPHWKIRLHRSQVRPCNVPC